MTEEVGVSSANECLSVFHGTKITRESHVSSGTADPLVSLVFQWWCLQSDDILPLFAFTLWYDASPRSWYTLEKLKPNIFEKFFWTEDIYENYAGSVYISWRSLGIKVIENIYRLSGRGSQFPHPSLWEMHTGLSSHLYKKKWWDPSSDPARNWRMRPHWLRNTEKAVTGLFISKR